MERLLIQAMAIGLLPAMALAQDRPYDWGWGMHPLMWGAWGSQEKRSELTLLEFLGGGFMTLKASAFGFAVGIVVAAAFTVCSIFVAVAPAATAEFIGYLLHINLVGLTRSISWASYFAGVIGLGVWTGLWAAAAAKVYNLAVSQ